MKIEWTIISGGGCDRYFSRRVGLRAARRAHCALKASSNVTTDIWSWESIGTALTGGDGARRGCLGGRRLTACRRGRRRARGRVDAGGPWGQAAARRAWLAPAPLGGARVASGAGDEQRGESFPMVSATSGRKTTDLFLTSIFSA